MAKKEITNRTIDKNIMEVVKGLPPSAGKAVIEAYKNEMPFVVKDAINDFYVAIDGIKGRDSISELNKAIKRLQDVCEANPDYYEIFDAAQKEAKDKVSNFVANNGLDLFETL